jgi:hypothetical protein
MKTLSTPFFIPKQPLKFITLFFYSIHQHPFSSFVDPNQYSTDCRCFNGINQEEPDMKERIYKKMAGTSAIFIPADYASASPVERDGLVWTDTELSMPSSPQTLQWKPPLMSTLALEGLEEYDPPSTDDARYVNNLDIAFVYIGKIRGWVALTNYV